MSTIAEQIHSARALAGAPRVAAPPHYAVAVELAMAHARARLSLPARVPLVFVSHPTGNHGETWWWPDGRVEVRVNVGADLSPRELARVVLHEARHVADGQQFCTRWPGETEKSAVEFADFVMRELAPEAFNQLSWRRPSGRR
jgi:hypothetical protein